MIEKFSYPSYFVTGKRVSIQELRPWNLLPKNLEYVTYEGSLTSPGCHETVTWIIINYPLYINKSDVSFCMNFSLNFKGSRILIQIILWRSSNSQCSKKTKKNGEFYEKNIFFLHL